MPAYFLDSSALVKHYAREIGTAWILGLFRRAAGNRLYILRLAEVEVSAALTRRVRSNSFGAPSAAKAVRRFERELVNRYSIVEVTPPLVADAKGLTLKHGLRGYDAMQLAAALRVETERLAVGAKSLILISADLELNAAAQREGLTVDDPNAHP